MNNRFILIVVAFSMFMESVDTTIINTAIPVMARSFNVDPIDLKLALISYLLSLAVFIPISGWLGDKFGIKKIFMCAIVIFTVSSLWCGFTSSLWQLIIARTIQGLGGSLTLPLGRLIIIRTYKRHELISKMSVVVMIASLGMMLGPLLGGIITNHFSWRWIFWVNVPFGLLTLMLSAKFFPPMPARLVHSLDKLGFILFGSGLALLTLGLSSLSESNISKHTSFIMIAFSVLLLMLYIGHSRNKAHPIVKIELLKTRTFRVSALGNLLSRFGFGGIPFLLPLLLQICLGFSPVLSGMLLVPIALGVLLVKPLSFYILQFFGYKKFLILNTLCVALSLWSFSSINASSSAYYIGFLTFVYGFLIATQYTGMNSLAYADLTQDSTSAATSIMSTIQQLAQSFGVAAGAIMLGFFSSDSAGHTLLTIQTFHHTFYVMGIFTATTVFIFATMKQGDGDALLESKPI